ncbi:MAG: hypothetical protein ACE5Q6_24260, partial [Dehalococcoidia bacterium]
MSTEELTYEDPQEDIPEPGGQGSLECAFCPETFNNPVNRYNHERSYHPEQFRQASPDGRKRGSNPRNNGSRNPPREETGGYTPVTIAGVRMDSVHELTRKFAETLDNVAHDMNPGKKKQIVLAFDDIAYQVNQDSSRLERFLNRCGVSASQAEYIKLVLLGLDDDKPQWGQPSWGQPPGGMQAMT